MKGRKKMYGLKEDAMILTIIFMSRLSCFRSWRYPVQNFVTITTAFTESDYAVGSLFP